MTDGSLTTGQRLERIENQVEAVLGIVHQLDSRDLADMRRLEAHERRITNLEARNQWTDRIIIGAVIAAVLGLVLGVGGAF